MPNAMEQSLRARISQLEAQLAREQRSALISRLSERRYRELTEAIPQLVWATDRYGATFYCNRRWYIYTGLSEEESLGFGFINVVHPDDREQTLAQWERTWRDGGHYENEYRLRRHDGVYHWFIGRAAPVADPNGQVVEWLGTCTDIDDQKRAANELHERTDALRQITATLQERNRELDQFAYVASHDLKAPLRGIASLAQWIEDDLGVQLTDEVRKHLELLRGRVQRMERLINGLLQYSRVGRTVGTLSAVEVDQLLAETIDLLAPPPTATIKITTPMPTLYTERLLLHQVFANLIGNALKHHPGPTITLQISAQRSGPFYRFVVTDDGPGIAPQFHQRIFTIFQTLAPRDTFECSGMGLALVKKIVEHQGGQVSLESEEGKGATFFFTWPAR